MISSWYIGRFVRKFGELFRSLQIEVLVRNMAAWNLTNVGTSNVTRPLFISIFIAELIFAFLPVISYYVDGKLSAVYGRKQAGEGFCLCYWFTKYLCIDVNWLCLSPKEYLHAGQEITRSLWIQNILYHVERNPTRAPDLSSSNHSTYWHTTLIITITSNPFLSTWSLEILALLRCYSALIHS